MNSTLGAYEVKTHLSSLLDRVARGEEFTITKHGVPVARLVPVTGRPKRDVLATIQAIRELRRGNSLGGLKIRDLIEEGRRRNRHEEIDQTTEVPECTPYSFHS